MKFTVSSLSKGGGSSDFPKPKVAAQEGRICRVIDRGVRKPSNPKFKPARQLMLQVELSEDKVIVEKDGKKEEKPMMASLFVNVSGKRKGGQHSKFTQLVSDILDIDDNTEFSLDDFLGKAVGVKLSKGQDGELNGFIESLNPLSKRIADTVPALVADSYSFSFDQPDPHVLLEKFSDSMRDRIKESLSYPGSDVEKIIEGKSVADKQEHEQKDVM